jgi:hypothetical protein
VVFALAIAALVTAGKRVGAGFHGHEHTEEEHVAISTVPDTGLAAQFESQADLPGQVTVVRRALELDPSTGAELAVRFLESSPPLFYGQRVVTTLDSLATEPIGFDVSQPPTSAQNQAALARIRAEFNVRGERSREAP